MNQIKDMNVKVWHAILTLIPIFFVIIGVGFTYASGVDQNTKDVVEIKAEVKDLSAVKVDINKLNVSTATLQSEVEHIKESQQRAERQIQETNTLLRELIVESKERNRNITPNLKSYNRRRSW